MDLNQDSCYKIIQNNDPRFDGVFFVGVKTTGIYCRSVCKVPAPKKENCSFYASKAEAEKNGFRPCLRCRPDMAPNYSEFNQSKELIHMLLDYFEDSFDQSGLISKASVEYGISKRHIQRLFQKELGLTPSDYLMTKRLLKGKTLLQNTNLSVSRISQLAGFHSKSSFYSAFNKHYHLKPTDLRKSSKTLKSENIQVFLSYRPPYNLDTIMDFFKQRAIPHVEVVTKDRIYRRSLRLEKNKKLYKGYLEVKPLPLENRFKLTISKSLEEVLLPIIKLVRKVFDLDSNFRDLPANIQEGIRLPGCFDPFEMATRTVLGQQISVSAATTLSGRLAKTFGQKASSPWPEISYFFPSPKEISHIPYPEDAFGQLGIIGARTKTILSLSEKILTGKLSFDSHLSIDDLRQELLKIKGIGIWSADYMLMRGLSWPDVFLATDLVIKKKLLPHLYTKDMQALETLTSTLSSYKLNKEYEKAAYAWSTKFSPWASYLTISIWNDLIDWSLTHDMYKNHT